MLLEMLLVISVIDGDTIKVIDKQHQSLSIKVRLASIDAPERGQPFGNRSKQMLAGMIAGKSVNLDCPSQDRYQRYICTVSDSAGLNVNREMVKQGGAWVYRQYYSGTEYIQLENQARSQRRGLWHTSEYQAVPPWEWRRQQREARGER